MFADANPYASPLLDEHSAALPVYPRRAGAAAWLLARGWLYRKIFVEAPIQAVIEYKGFGVGESVAVDGRTVSRKINAWWFAPSFEFTILTERDDLPVAVRVSVWPWLALRRFRVEMGRTTLYDEGT